MKHVFLALALLFVAASAETARADSYTYCAKTPNDPRPPNSTNPGAPHYEQVGGSGNYACLDVASFAPIWDDDGDPYTAPKCYPDHTDPDGVVWTFAVIQTYPNGDHKRCASYYTLPPNRCTGSGVGTSGRLVHRLGPGHRTYAKLVALGWNVDDYCLDSVYYPLPSCNSSGGGWTHIQNLDGTCSALRSAVAAPPSSP